MKLLCFGMGYVASFIKGDFDVIGTHRDNPPYRFDLNCPLPKEIFLDVTHILISIPPDDDGDLVIRMHAPDIASAPLLSWVGYLSSTGVYGNHDGQWVNEDSDLLPTSKRAENRVLAEQQWLELFTRYDLPINIFRLGGIYGPGRSVFDQVEKTRVDKPGQYFSRIHVADIVQVLQKSMASGDRGQIYNLADDEPCESRKLIEYACELSGEKYPPLVNFQDAQLSPMAQEFYRDNKRVTNTKIKSQLGLSLLYPTYREGLKDIWHKLSN